MFCEGILERRDVACGFTIKQSHFFDDGEPGEITLIRMEGKVYPTHRVKIVLCFIVLFGLFVPTLTAQTSFVSFKGNLAHPTRILARFKDANRLQTRQ